MNIWTIIVTYNSAAFIKKCIDSVIEGSIMSKIAVIDNNSSDETREIVSSYEDVVLIENNSNFGFGKANNQGIELALRDRADYVFLLNQDAWLAKHALQNITNIAKKNVEYGILGPIQYNEDWISVEKIFDNYCNENKLLVKDLAEGKNSQEIYDVPFINAAGWLIDSKCIDRIGGFDPLFFMYGEDMDYIARLKFHNYKIGVVPTSKMVHARINSSPVTKKTFDQKELTKRRILKFGIKAICETKDLNKEFKKSKRIFSQQYIKMITHSLIYFNFFKTRLLMTEFRKYLSQLKAIKASREVCIKEGSHFLNL